MQEALNMNFEEDWKVQKIANLLPRPLYLVYANLCAYSEACGKICFEFFTNKPANAHLWPSADNLLSTTINGDEIDAKNLEEIDKFNSKDDVDDVPDSDNDDNDGDNVSNAIRTIKERECEIDLWCDAFFNQFVGSTNQRPSSSTQEQGWLVGTEERQSLQSAPLKCVTASKFATNKFVPRWFVTLEFFLCFCL